MIDNGTFLIGRNRVHMKSDHDQAEPVYTPPREDNFRKDQDDDAIPNMAHAIWNIRETGEILLKRFKGFQME